MLSISKYMYWKIGNFQKKTIKLGTIEGLLKFHLKETTETCSSESSRRLAISCYKDKF